MESTNSVTTSDLGPLLFSYVVIADTHLNHGEHETNSVYPVNALHNGRFRHVVREINNHENMEFVIHLGDLVHPVPAIPDQFHQASKCFKDIIAELNIPFHVIPGNHDVGDKSADWTPAICVADEYLDIYRDEFGPDYFAFEHKGVHFIMLNTSLINSGLASERVQQDWLEQYFKTHAGDRFIVNIHYPVFLADRDETPHYDNIEEPGRTWLLDLLEQNKVEALFSAHTHNFWYQRFARTDFYYALSTACIRQDYSEIVRTPPDEDMEGGRNDQPKHGYFLIDIHEKGHICHIRRTYGEVIEPEVETAPAIPKIKPLHPLQNTRAKVGFDMRQDWMDEVHIPPSGGPDEFNRKVARNDYALMTIWEMGVRRMRIPRIDMQTADRRERLRILRGHGNEFVLYTFGVPDARFLKILSENPDLISAWEITFRWQDLAKVSEQIAALRADISVPIYLSKLRGKEEHDASGGKYVHAINHGFVTTEADQINELVQTSQVEGVVFRLGSDDAVWENVMAAGEICAAANISGSMNTRMSPLNPSEFRKDDLWVANRVGEAIAATVTQNNLHIMIDTLADFDRGFFRRHGVVDRLYNPRLGFHIIRNLYGALNSDQTVISAGEVLTTDKIRSVSLKRGTEKLVLVMPNESGVTVDHPEALGLEASTNIRSHVDLQTGVIKSGLPKKLDTPILLIE